MATTDDLNPKPGESIDYGTYIPSPVPDPPPSDRTQYLVFCDICNQHSNYAQWPDHPEG